MELKPAKRILKYEQYRLEQFKDLDNKLLAGLHRKWPAGATHAVFQFRNKIRDEHKLAKRISRSYNVSIIYAANPGQIKTEGPDLPDNFKEVRVSYNKLRTLFKRQAKQVYQKIKKLTPAFLEELKSAEKLLKHSRHLCLYRNNRFAALYIVVHRTNYLGKECEWGLWMWGEPFLTTKENTAVLTHYLRWVKRIRLPLELKARSFAVSTQKLLRKSGFEPKYVTVAKIVKGGK